MKGIMGLFYLAGYFDGEGSITLSRGSNGHYTLVCGVSGVKPNALKLFHERFGGSLYYQKRTNAKWRDIFMWRISGEKAELFLEEIKPYLILKKDEAELGLTFRYDYQSKRITHTPENCFYLPKEEYYEIMKILKWGEYAQNYGQTQQS